MTMATGIHEAVDDHPRLMRRAAIASLSVSIFLVAIKAIAYFGSHSVSVLAALTDSGLDLFTSTLNVIAIRSALTPADAEHRFGHGKAEPLAGLAQGAFIAGSASFLIVQAISRFITPAPVQQGSVALAIMLISVAAATGLVFYQRYVVAKTGSIAIAADRMHYLADVATNAGVIVALILAVIYLLLERISRSPWGRLQRAIRDEENSAAMSGKNVALRRVESFVLGSFIMGVAGAVYAHYVVSIDYSHFNPLFATFIVWVMLMLGGSGNNKGAILGAFVVWAVWTGTQSLVDLIAPALSIISPDLPSRSAYFRWMLVAILLAAIVLYRPEGIIRERKRVSDFMKWTGKD